MLVFHLSDLEAVYLDLCVMARDAREHIIRFIVGGDFNTSFEKCVRGDMLADFLNEFNMRTAAICNGDIESSWTFRSSMDYKRQIDFNFHSGNCTSEDAHPTDELHLGSDHRAVKSKFYIEMKKNEQDVNDFKKDGSLRQIMKKKPVSIMQT